MPWAAAAVVGAAVVGGVIQSQAAADAASQQTQMAAAGILEQRRQQEEAQAILEPYQYSGEKAISAQRALMGLEGPEAQQAAFTQIEESPQFQGLVSQGENAILQNAAATGGLRGGNTQAALAQFRPQMMQSAISDQIRNLGGLSTLGQAAASQQAAQGVQFGSNVTGLLGDIGAANAGATLARGQAQSNVVGTIGQVLGGF